MVGQDATALTLLPTSPATVPALDVLLVVNPVAARVRKSTRHEIERTLAADHDVNVVETDHRDHATELAREAAEAGTDVVVVFGGDGTLNEAANGVAGTGTALAGIPGGSTNVFPRTLGTPRDPVEATTRLLAALARGSVRPIGVGSANGRAFLFHLGMGYDAAVVGQVERRPTLKRRLGQAIFVYAALDTWARHYDRGRPRFSVRVGDHVVDDGYFAICLNTNPYTYLGSRPLCVAPDATLDRGLSLITLRTLALLPTLAITCSVLGSGARARDHELTDYRPDVTTLTVTGHGPFPYQADGDYLGEVDELVIDHRPGALRMVLP